MEKSFSKMLAGYRAFREKYALGDNTVMQYLAHHGQQPETMIIACCDSRVDPALILQCEPGDLFVVRNVANIIPPYEKKDAHHEMGAALEFGICFLNVKHLIILGHSGCGGVNAAVHPEMLHQNDFIYEWVSLIKPNLFESKEVDHCAKQALIKSYEHAFTFPWISERVEQQKLKIHLWFFDIKESLLYNYDLNSKEFKSLAI
jgi:carbonic anhydrase